MYEFFIQLKLYYYTAEANRSRKHSLTLCGKLEKDAKISNNLFIYDENMMIFTREKASIILLQINKLKKKKLK